MRILIVEDHEILWRNLQTFLSIKNIESHVSRDGEDGLFLALTEKFDMIILDINLPKLSGVEVCQKLREKWKNTPVLMLTSRSAKTDIITWLDIGADDYMTKPFDYDELFARINSLTRRNLENKSTTKIAHKNFVIDLKSAQVFIDDREVKLSNLEFELLKYFSQNREKIIPKSELYENVWWEYDDFHNSKTVDVYIGYLRKKMGKDIVETKKGFWYIMH